MLSFSNYKNKKINLSSQQCISVFVGIFLLPGALLHYPRAEYFVSSAY